MAARLWHKAPFIRLLTAFAAGVVLQWYLPFPFTGLLLCFGAGLFLLLVYSVLSLKQRFRFGIACGVILLLVLAALGGLAVHSTDVRNNSAWFGHAYHNGDDIMATTVEPLVEKANSYKAIATVTAVLQNGRAQQTTGRIILYFKKEDSPLQLPYGSRILFRHTLQPIKNAGNPGSFDYQTYSLFQGITHQVFLSTNDYVVLPGTEKNAFRQFIFDSRAWVVATLKKFIRHEKEQGLAEALLIGYKDDLDKNLVQAYSNTGVVHIIAISGLHLGLIYGLLLLLTKPMKRIKKLRLFRLLLIVASLWLFSILAGGGPSVLRSALMFSLMAVGELALRKTNVFNTLAFSAFVLLCIDPFWLWDVGFQLSYAAVLSIILFFQPIYNWIKFSNKGIDFLWKLTAVTMSAQILTLPISIYHFHQMPLLFLFTNFLAVPLSSLILMGEILLCCLSVFPAVAAVLGTVLQAMIGFMNSYIEGLDRLPFSTWNFLSIDLLQAALLVLFALAFCYWLLEKQRPYAWIAFSSLAMFMLLRSVSFYTAYRQRQLIVYNVPRHPAIDIINGRSYHFLGDSLLLFDGFERNFHLQPSRILHRISADTCSGQPKQFALAGKRIVLLDESLSLATVEPKPTIDVLVLSKNPKLYIGRLQQSLAIGQIVIDGSVPPWKAALWKKDCDSLHIPCYDVSERGAFVLNW